MNDFVAFGLEPGDLLVVNRVDDEKNEIGESAIFMGFFAGDFIVFRNFQLMKLSEGVEAGYTCCIRVIKQDS